MPITKLSPGNIAQSVYELDSESIRVNLVGSGSPILPNVVRLSDGTDYLSSTVVGSDRALDVNVVNNIELTVDHADDSIRLGDGTNFITSTSGGGKVALDVNVNSGSLNGTFTQAPSGATVTAYGTQTVAIGATSTVVQYTVPAGNPVYLQKIYISGEAIGKYTIYQNASILTVYRMSQTTYSQTLDLATTSAFGIVTSPGDVIKVDVENNGTSVSVFDGTIQVMQT